MKVVFACIFNEFAIARTNEQPKKCITSFVGISSLIFEIVTEQRRRLSWTNSEINSWQCFEIFMSIANEFESH